jgi:CHAT domain-containing protein
MEKYSSYWLYILTFLFVAMLFPICASAINDPVDDVDRAFASGRFGEMATLLEPMIGELQNGKSEQLVRLCFAYSKIKSYKKLDACLDEWAKKIRTGDQSGGKYGSWWAKPTWFVTSRMPSGLMFGTKDWDITPYPHIMRAEAAIDQGDYHRAITEAELARSKLTSNQTQGNYFQIDVLGLLAMAHALSGQNEKAMKFIDELSKMDVASFATSSAEIYLRTTLARSFFAVKSFKKALDVISQDKTSGLRAMASFFTNLKDEESLWRWEEVPRDYMRFKCEMEIGRTQDAKAGFDRLLANPQIGDHSGLYWMLLFERGRIAEFEGDAGAAIRYFKSAVEAIEQLRSTINTEASKIGFVGDKQAVYARLIATLVEQGQAGEAFDYVERSKSRALVDMLASKKDFAAPESDPEKVKLVLAQLDAADLGARIQDASTKPDARPTGSRNLQVARDALQSAAPELSSLVTVTSVPSTKLSSLLGTDETLIEYYYNGDNLIAFVLSSTGLSVIKLNGSGLDSQVQALRTAIEQPGTEAWHTLSRALYEKLWKPLETSIQTKNVIIVAHGSLHYLPFSVLQAGDGGLLIDRVSLRFLPSASVLKFLHPLPAKKDSQLLVLGNPDLGDAKLDLKFAESEARLIAGMSKTSRLLVRLDASEANLKKTAGIFSRLHFATHGKFQADDPLRSGLYLAKDAKNDGVLTVGELYSMNLDADLVTLSACETGLGKVANGDDVVGLTRGFLYAGSRSIVASLWSVDDQATATLMKAFYENLSNQNKREALRLAQLKTRKTFPHPFYWAAFQLTGRAD